MTEITEIDFDHPEVFIDQVKENIGEDNCEILKKQISDPTEEIDLKVLNFISFKVKNPLLLPAKQAKYFISSTRDLVLFTNNCKNNEDFVVKFDEKIVNFASHFVNICGKNVNPDDENDRIYACDSEFLFVLFEVIAIIYLSKKKNSYSQTTSN